ncbi:MAG: hypothetical protein AB7I27_16385 [Bacteriovoracaceae bacterium]
MKKINWKKGALLSLALLSFHSFAGADGTRGGESVNIDNHPRLRDLVEKSVCEWQSGNYFFKSEPMLKEVLKQLAQVDWYFSSDLENQINSLNYCLTGALVKIDTADQESLTATYSLKAKQVGIRLYDTVYLDYALMQSMPELDRSMLIIHEAMHSYLNYEESMRNQKLRSQVRVVRDVFEGRVSERSLLHLSMKNNSIQFPLLVDLLDSKKSQVQYLISSAKEKREVLLKVDSVKDWIKSVLSIPQSALTAEDSMILKNISYEQVISLSINSEDVELLKKLLKESKEQVLMAIYANDSAMSSKVIQQLLLEQGHQQDFANIILNDLSTKVLTVVEDRIFITGLDLVAKEKDSSVLPLNSLTPFNKDEYFLLSNQAKIFVKTIATHLNNNDWEKVGQLTYQNPVFSRAFELNSVSEVISKTSVDDLEKTTAQRKIKVLYRGFWQVVGDAISKSTSPKKWKELAVKINALKLGYEIK